MSRMAGSSNWRIVEGRGPCPGLGSALSAFGLELGTFVARAILDKAGDNADPWPLVDKAFAEPKKHLPAELANGIGKTMREKWSRLPDERRSLLKLLSCFEITRDQAATLYVQPERKKAGIDVDDEHILANPYLLYELTRFARDPVSVWTVDRRVFPDAVIRKKHPLPEPTALDAGTDARRVRAMAVKVLEDSSGSGNTLMSQDQAVLAIRGLAIEPPCDVDSDLIDVAKDDFDDVIVEVPLANKSPALQLGRLDAPAIEYGNSLAVKITEIGQKDRVDVIDEVNSLTQKWETVANGLLMAEHHKIANQAPRRRLGDVAPLIRRPADIDPSSAYPQVSVRSFGRGTFHNPPLHGSEITWQKPHLVKEGDILVSNIKAWEGALAVAGPDDDGRYGSHRYLTFVPVDGVATAHFLCFYLLSPEGLYHVGEASPGSADRNRTLSSRKMLDIEVPVPPFHQQQRFDKLLARITDARRVRNKGANARDALLPSILDRAFRGGQ